MTILLLLLSFLIGVQSYLHSTVLPMKVMPGKQALGDDVAAATPPASAQIPEFLPRVLLLQGEVMKGYGRGSKKLGVPTANLPHFDKQLQDAKYQRGVYFGWGSIVQQTQEKIVPCVANIGVSPTFVGQENSINIIEAHFLDCAHNGDFYGKEIRLCLVGFLRPEQKFKSLADLVEQINADIQLTRILCAPPLEGTALEARRIAEQFLSCSPDEISQLCLELVNGYNLEIVPGAGEKQSIWGFVPIMPEPSTFASAAQLGWTPAWMLKR